ncbi:MAG: DNA mismatch repair protein MutS [Spirochaetales bacterium]|nr:DNA mismatch repair protein MutS [Spirochaetales bacterium]
MAKATTPMMIQYKKIKRNHSDAILFFRLGDFYEMFESDAREASHILDLTLTQRHGIPMCGIPYHAASAYIQRLIKAGKKIAVCEQTQLPADGKGIATREVVEVITPGTLVDEKMLDRSLNNYLVAIAAMKNRISFSYIDLSTAEFCVTSFEADEREEQLKSELYRLSPREVIISEDLYESDPVIQRLLLEKEGIFINRFPVWYFDAESTAERLKKQLKVANLKGFGLAENSPEVISAGAVLSYLEDTSKNMLGHISSITVYAYNSFVALDEATQKNLELVRNISDNSRRYSLLEVLNHAKSAMGSRKLYTWILSPLVDPKEITDRQQAVDYFYHNQKKLSEVRELLGNLLDIERLAARTAMDRAHAKDLVAIKRTLTAVLELGILLGSDCRLQRFMQLYDTHAAAMNTLADSIDRGILDDPSVLLTEGGIIRDGFDEELDRLRTIRDNAKEILKKYLEAERTATGINSLKLRYNKIIGYFLEVSKPNLHLIPQHFSRRQSLVGGERFTTQVLIDRETEINSASERIVELERELFLKIRDQVKQAIGVFREIGDCTAEMDVYQSFAYAATINGYVCPRVGKHSTITIKNGRHPVVETYLPAGTFVPNDVFLDNETGNFILLTGPNMAGKSTYLRQTALITLMAQIGSFVPADEANIGIVDKIFCRVGSSDNIARGESTFLSEMNETAHILRQATSRSLIIMDEVGRGTSTNDGLAIAWAVSMYILEKISAKTLFATHFHELSGISHPLMRNLSFAVAERDDTIVFLKKIKDGPADSSYGIHVAEIAGLPAEVIQTAYAFQENPGAGPADSRKAPVVTHVRPPKQQPQLFKPEELIIESIKGLSIEELKPIDAINLLALWQDELENQDS